MNIENCPIKHLSLHVKLKQCVENGTLEEVPVYHSGFGSGKALMYNGNKIKIRRKIKGHPRWKNGVPDGLFFHESHDVAYDPETSTLIAWAPAL